MSESDKPITVTVQRAEEITGLGHTTVSKLIKDAKLRSVKIGGRRLVYYESIEALLAGA